MDEKKKEFLGELGRFIGRKIVEASPYVATDLAFKKVFYHHTYSDPLSSFDNELFPNLVAQRATFDSKGNNLVGYYYLGKDTDKSKIVIFAHGMGNGHHKYLDIINYLVENGIYVFSYDLTSFDESEGEGTYGFPQGIIDLESAINFVKKDQKYKEEQIILMGHSWGGFSIGATLNLFPNISKAIMLSGFNRSSEVIKQHGIEWAGNKIESTLDYIDEYEEYRFKEYHYYSVIEGIEKSNSKIYVIHSQDDNTVPIESGLDLYEKHFGKSSRIKYERLKDRGHGTVYCSKEGRKYYETIEKEYKKYLKDNKDASAEDKKHLFNLLVDNNKWTNMLDHRLMDSIVDFIKK